MKSSSLFRGDASFENVGWTRGKIRLPESIPNVFISFLLRNKYRPGESRLDMSTPVHPVAPPLVPFRLHKRFFGEGPSKILQKRPKTAIKFSYDCFLVGMICRCFDPCFPWNDQWFPPLPESKYTIETRRFTIYSFDTQRVVYFRIPCHAFLFTHPIQADKFHHKGYGDTI